MRERERGPTTLRALIIRDPNRDDVTANFSPHRVTALTILPLLSLFLSRPPPILYPPLDLRNFSPARARLRIYNGHVCTYISAYMRAHVQRRAYR